MPTGAIDGHWSQILNQLAGVGIAWGISIVGTLVLLFVVDKIIGLRVSAEDEPMASTSPSTAKKATTSTPDQFLMPLWYFTGQILSKCIAAANPTPAPA